MIQLHDSVPPLQLITLYLDFGLWIADFGIKLNYIPQSAIRNPQSEIAMIFLKKNIHFV
jgi:hypothetical protein